MGMRVLVTTPGSLGHLHPMVPLAEALLGRGHEVLWAVPPRGVAHVAARGIPAVESGSADAPGPAAALREYPELRQLPPLEVGDVLFGKLFGAIAAPAMLADLAPVALEWRPDLVVSDAAEFAGHIVAAELGVPSVTKGFGSLLPERRVALAGEEVADLWRSRGLEPRPYGGSYTHLYLDIYPPELQLRTASEVPRRQLLRPVADTGTLDAGAVLPLPDTSADAPLLYVTMGTVFNDPVALKLVLDALGELDVRALVTVGPDGDPEAVGSVPPRIRVERYVPQAMVLPHCDAVVSHGGSGTVLATLTAGLPQVCVPQGADQFLNAAAVGNSGAGVSLMPGDVTAATLRDAVVRVLGDSAFGQAARRISASIASMPPPEDVAALLETVP